MLLGDVVQGLSVETLIPEAESYLAEYVSDVYRGCSLEFSSTLHRIRQAEISHQTRQWHTFESSASFPAFGFLLVSLLSAGFLSVFLAIGPMGVRRLKMRPLASTRDPA